jgi:hypothetical protein
MTKFLKPIGEGIIQARTPNSDKDRAHLQASKRLQPSKPEDVHPAIRKKSVSPPDPKSEPEGRPETDREPDLKELLARARKNLPVPAKAKDDPEAAKAKEFSAWMSKKGKDKFEPSKKEEQVQEETDKAAMHTDVANALVKSKYENKHHIARKRKLARQYRKMQPL